MNYRKTCFSIKMIFIFLFGIYSYLDKFKFTTMKITKCLSNHVHNARKTRCLIDCSSRLSFQCLKINVLGFYLWVQFTTCCLPQITDFFLYAKADMLRKRGFWNKCPCALCMLNSKFSVEEISEQSLFSILFLVLFWNLSVSKKLTFQLPIWT